MGYQRAKPYTCCEDAMYSQTDISRDDNRVEVKSECRECGADWKDVFEFSHTELDDSDVTTQYRQTEQRSCCDDPSMEHSNTWNEGEQVEVFKNCLNCGADWKYVFTYSHAMVQETALN